MVCRYSQMRVVRGQEAGNITNSVKVKMGFQLSGL